MSWYFWPLAIGGGAILSLIWVIILALVLFDMLRANRTPEWKIVWIMILLLLPIIGAVFYYFLGKDKKLETRWRNIHGSSSRYKENSQKN